MGKLRGSGQWGEEWVAGQLSEPELIGCLFLQENPASYQEHGWISAPPLHPVEDIPAQLQKMEDQVGELSPQITAARGPLQSNQGLFSSG